MIAALTGRLAAKAPSHITLEVQGVGYEVFIPLSTFYALPDLNESTGSRPTCARMPFSSSGS